LPFGKVQVRRPRSVGLACIPGSQAFRIANISPGVSSDSQAKRPHFRIAGVSPACGCTQPLMSEVLIATAFLFAYRQSAGGTPAIRWSRLLFRIAGETPAFILYFLLQKIVSLVPQKLLKRNLINKFRERLQTILILMNGSDFFE
jgi:hypothetical protein